MKNKKAAQEMVWIVIITVLLLLFMLVYSGTLVKLYYKMFSSTNKQISSLDDFDKDEISNFIDKCPCVGGEKENSGCRAGYKPSGKAEGQETRECLS